MPMPNRQSTAVHEAAHAVVGAVLGAAPMTVTLFERGGECEFDPEALAAIGTENQLIVFAAGVQAQFLILGENPARPPTFDDFDMMRQATAGLHPAWGQQMRQQAHDRARQLVEKHRQGITAVADALLDRGHLSASDLRRLLRPYGL